MAIKLLSEEIINQIAAGEVIENPAAVIKELVENSLDAKAMQIEVELENYGLDRIVIRDDGFGISKEDLINAPKRHATSKIESFNDLYNINSMGFRGEALASIFSVSKTKIVSKQEGEDAFEISSRYVDEIKQSACQKGTTIYVEDIFYNTPARKKYLRSPNLELKSILEIFGRYLISNPQVKFSLKHNGRILVNKPAFKTCEENLFYVLGRELQGNLVYFEKEKKGMKISGFFGKPTSITYSYQKNQFLFVNDRYIRSKLLKNAIYEGFGTNLMGGRHPFFVVFVEIDPEVIDVNIHPTKIEIKFEDELEIFEFLRSTIEETFTENELMKSFEMPKERDYELGEKIDEIEPSQKRIEKAEPKSYFSYDTQKPLELKEEGSAYEKSLNSSVFEEKEEVSHQNLLGDILKEYKIIGQVNKTFVILETPSEMLIMDQHVAEEKFYFEMFREQTEGKKKQMQTLIKPQIILLNAQENLLYEENKEIIDQLGFKCEKFGNNEVMVRAVPITLNGKILSPDVLKELICEIGVDKKFKKLDAENLEKLSSLACKRSIKGGEELTNPQIHKLIDNLKKLKEPFNCPHGRPLLLRYSFTDLEKKFKRIV